MKMLICSAAFVVALVTVGCKGNQKQPGPKAGYAVGAAAGTAVGNVAAGTAAAGAGAAAGVGNAFEVQPTRIVRHWVEEQTPDGRTILVPVDYEVDAEGRVIRQVKTK